MVDVVQAATAEVAKVEAAVAPVVAAAKTDLASLEVRVKALETTVVLKATTLWGKAKSWVTTHYVALLAASGTPVGVSVLKGAWAIVKHFV